MKLLLAPILLVLWGACGPTTASSDATVRAGTRPDERPDRAPGGVAVAVDTLAPGVVARWTRDPAGPWSVHTIEVAHAACGIDVRSVKAGDALIGRETTSALAAVAAEAEGRPVLAAVNADFFSFDPPGVPTGLHVQAGRVVAPPSTRPAFTIGDDGSFFIGTVRLEAGVRMPDGRHIRVHSLNRADPDGAVLLNRFAAETPARGERAIAWIRSLTTPGRAATGDTVRGVVVTVDTAAIDDAATVRLLWPPAAAPGATLSPGDTIRWWTTLEGPARPVRDAVGGTPVLVRTGRNVVAEAELSPAFRDQRHPRTAVGWRRDGTLLLVVVDGRQPGYSDGMSLDELADLMLALGAIESLNLDGGGSTTIVLRGVVANRPSDRQLERPVANALVVLGPAAEGPCA